MALDDHQSAWFDRDRFLALNVKYLQMLMIDKRIYMVDDGVGGRCVII